MPFIPHTESDIQAMLKSIGVSTTDELFDEIPPALRTGQLKQTPEGLSELQVTQLIEQRADQDRKLLNFIGAGAYEHFIPAAVWQITTRGEFYSAYTPYQAEASQGTLQLIYEFQTMIASLTGMDVANASLYDGATALAEAVLMAVRSHKNSRTIAMPRTVHPIYRKVVRDIVGSQNIIIEEIDYDKERGIIAPGSTNNFAALVIPQPNFFGSLEEVDTLTDWAHDQDALVIAVVNPVSLALLSAPGQWGKNGADIAVGEGQPLGAPLSSGGPYFGFMCCKQALVRQMPGRIVGRTVDLDGKPGFALTLQAREQHIRRGKATSNICTNQGLLVTAATIHMSLLGPAGLRQAAVQSHRNTEELVKQLSDVTGVRRKFTQAFFHEAVIEVPIDAAQLLRFIEAKGIVGGIALNEYYPELGNAILTCATETKTISDIEKYASALKHSLT